jgi:hypothetical protein
LSTGYYFLYNQGIVSVPSAAVAGAMGGAPENLYEDPSACPWRTDPVAVYRDR